MNGMACHLSNQTPRYCSTTIMFILGFNFHQVFTATKKQLRNTHDNHECTVVFVYIKCILLLLLHFTLLLFNHNTLLVVFQRRLGKGQAMGFIKNKKTKICLKTWGHLSENKKHYDYSHYSIFLFLLPHVQVNNHLFLLFCALTGNGCWKDFTHVQPHTFFYEKSSENEFY